MDSEEHDTLPSSPWWTAAFEKLAETPKYTHAFHAKGNFEHTGCAETRLNFSTENPAMLAEVGLKLPNLIGIGVQKGGTTDIFAELVANRGWNGKAGIQFFNNVDFRRNPPVNKAVLSYIRKFKNYAVNIEKSPGYLNSEHAPLRACETMPRSTKFVLMLREPVGRSYSAFHQKPDAFSITTGLGVDVDGFHALAETESAMTDKCNPFGTSNHQANVVREASFLACCHKVALSFGHAQYPCEHYGHMRDVNGSRLSKGLQKRMMMYPVGYYAGMFNIDAVRRGVYSAWLAMWLKFIEPERLLLIDSYDYFKHPDEVIADVDTFVTGVPNRGRTSAAFVGCFKFQKRALEKMERQSKLRQTNMKKEEAFQRGPTDLTLTYEACKAQSFAREGTFFGMENPASNHYNQYAHCWQFDEHPTKSIGVDGFATLFYKVEDDSLCGAEEKMMRGPPRRLGSYLHLALYETTYENSQSHGRTRRNGGIRIHKDTFHHSKNSKTPVEPMRNDTLKLLQAFYKPWNKKLEEMVGRKMDWGY